MNDAVQESDPLLGTSTLRGILLLGGVAAVAYIAYKFYLQSKKADTGRSAQSKFIRVPVELPIPANKSVRK